MLASLILSACAGFGVQYAEPAFRGALHRALKDEVPLGPVDFRLLTFVVLMALAALLTTAMGADSSAFAAVLGGGLGYFGPGLWQVLRKPNDVADGSRWDGAVHPPGARPVRRPHEDDDATLQAVSDALKDGESPPDTPHTPPEEPRR